MNAEELLMRVPLFQGQSKKHIGQIAKLSTTQRYEAGQAIVRQGDSGLGLYVIASGTVDVQRERNGGEPIVLATLGTGDFFGEMSLLDDYPRSATVVAKDAVECLTLVKWHFLAEIQTHPEMAVPMLSVLSRRVRNALQQLEAQA